MRNFIKEILQEDYGDNYDEMYNNSPLIKYLDKKTGAIDGDSKTRRSLGNIYAIYSVLYYYIEMGFYNDKSKYQKFDGFDYNILWTFCKKQYGGNKLQNHSLNSRLNTEFLKKAANDRNKELLIISGSKYWIHIDYVYVDNIDISKTVIKIIEKYIDLLKEKDFKLSSDLETLIELTDLNEKKAKIDSLLEEKSEARIFEIISYAILKNHYKNQYIYIGTSLEDIRKEQLILYKTGRTNANDGGIDFVMKPLGRFFQVTEVNKYDKYLLDMDKVLHFPITFVIKTETSKEIVLENIKKYICEKAGGMNVIIEKYENSIEEIITINELKRWLNNLNEESINNLINDIDTYYKIEFNIDDDSFLDESNDD